MLPQTPHKTDKAGTSRQIKGAFTQLRRGLQLGSLSFLRYIAEVPYTVKRTNAGNQGFTRVDPLGLARQNRQKTPVHRWGLPISTG